MITRLYVQNLRRIAQAELCFDPLDQLIVVDGPNGAGKSTLIGESLLWALYGEGREGRRHLERLVRRGGEDEGLCVEVTLVVAGVEYTIRRRRDRSHTTATFATAGVVTVEGASAVTAAVTALLGMDAASFRLGVLSPQGDLDGLTRMRPAERAQAISRLLRLQLVGRARDLGRAQWKSAKDALGALGPAPDVAALDADAVRAETDATVATAALTAARDAVAKLDAEIAAAAGVDEAWDAAQTQIRTLHGRLDAHRARAVALETTLAGLSVPDAVPCPDGEPAKVRAALAATEASISRAEATTEVLRYRDIAGDEFRAAQERLDEIEAFFAEHGTPTVIDAELHLAHAGLRDFDEATAAADKAVETARSVLADARARANARRDSHALGEVCDRCRRPVDDQLRAELATVRADEDAAADAEVAAAETALVAATQVRDEAVAAGTAAFEHFDELRRRHSTAGYLQAEHAELSRRAAVHLGQLQRTEDLVAVDLDELYRRRGELLLAAGAWDAYHDALRTRADAERERDRVTTELLAAQSDVADTTAALAAAEPDEALTAARVELDRLRQARGSETALFTDLAAHAARCAAEAEAARARAEDAADAVALRRRLQRDGHNAEDAARLLDTVLEKLAARLRPALQSAVSELVATMSDGRFTDAVIDDEYGVTVVDDGQPRSLEELSGGEQDLVALALRLALAELTVERLGGVGVVVLDEVFGSQDPARRRSVLAALRALRGRYGQIFAISHVGDLADAADAVIAVEPGEIDGARVAAVTFG